MILFGTEYKMRFTVSAQREISDMCKNGDIANIGELLGVERYSQRLDNVYAICASLNKGANAFAKYVLKEDKEFPVLERELFEVLDPAQVTELVQEIVDTISADRKTTVEAEAPKTKARSGD